MTSEAVETAPVEATPEAPVASAPAKRYAMFQGQGRDFSWGEAKFIRKGDIIEVERYDSRMIAALGAERTDWREVDPELIPLLAYCEPCKTYRHKETVSEHIDRVHRAIATPALQRLHEVQTRLALLDAAKKAILAAEKQAKADADKAMEEIKAVGIPLPDYAPDHSVVIDIQYRKEGVGTDAHLAFGRTDIKSAFGVKGTGGQSLGAFRV